MAPFDRPYTTVYCFAIVNIALSCTVFSYLTLNNSVIMKSGLEVTQCHSNWYRSKAWVRFPNSASIVTMALSCITSGIVRAMHTRRAVKTGEQ